MSRFWISFWLYCD